MEYRETPIKQQLPGSHYYEVRETSSPGGRPEYMTFVKGAPYGQHEGGRYFTDQYCAEYACELMDIAFSQGMNALAKVLAAKLGVTIDPKTLYELNRAAKPRIGE